VQLRQVVAERDQHAAVGGLQRHERLAGAQQRPERAQRAVAPPRPRAEQPGHEVDPDERCAERRVGGRHGR
jgi:hypothetical protein